MSSELEEQVIQNIRTVYDPDLGNVNIYDMGLIYKVDIVGSHADILMTLTSPSCPSADYLINNVKFVTENTPGISSSIITVTFDPPWSIENIEESLKYDLGLL